MAGDNEAGSFWESTGKNHNAAGPHGNPEWEVTNS